PGAPTKPRSSPYPMVILSASTPWSVAPPPSPSPQGDSRSPHEVAASTAWVASSAGADASAASRSAPHALAVSASAMTAAPRRAPRRRLLRFVIWSFSFSWPPRRQGRGQDPDLREYEHGCEPEHP